MERESSVDSTSDEQKDNHATTKPKGILKIKKDPSQKHKILWDEQNLVENEVFRGGHMKIDEPKTPYNREYHYEEDSEDPHTFVPKSPEQRSMNWNEIENAFNKAAEEKSRWEEPDDKSDKSDKSESEASGDEHKKEFKQKRKQHYNEFLAIKQMKEKLKEDEDEDDEQKHEDKSPKFEQKDQQQNKRKSIENDDI